MVNHVQSVIYAQENDPSMCFIFELLSCSVVSPMPRKMQVHHSMYHSDWEGLLGVVGGAWAI